MKILSLRECQLAAQESDNKAFIISFPSGMFNAEWLDAHLGLFTLKGESGHLMVRDLETDVPELNQKVYCFY
mgnify:CR=1 FL=1